VNLHISDYRAYQYQCYGGPFTCYYVCSKNYNYSKHSANTKKGSSNRSNSKNRKRVSFNDRNDEVFYEDYSKCDIENNNKNKVFSGVTQQRNSKMAEQLNTGNKVQKGFTSDWNSCIDAGSAALERRGRNTRQYNRTPTGSLQRKGQEQNKNSNNVFMQMRSNSVAKERKVNVMLIALVLVFAICWFPFFLVYVSEPLCRGNDKGDATKVVNNTTSKICIFLQDPVVFDVVTWLGYLNSMFNPIIYSLFIKDFRVVLKKLFCGLKTLR